MGKGTERGCGGPTNGWPEGGVPADPEVPPKAALEAEPKLRPPPSGISGLPAGTLQGLQAPGTPASCLPPRALAPQSHPLTHTLTPSHAPGLQVGVCPLRRAGRSVVAPWDGSGARPGVAETERAASDERDGSVSLVPVTRAPPSMSPRSQPSLGGTVLPPLCHGLVTGHSQGLSSRVSGEGRAGLHLATTLGANAGPTRHPGPLGRPRGVGGASRNGL